MPQNSPDLCCSRARRFSGLVLLVSIAVGACSEAQDGPRHAADQRIDTAGYEYNIDQRLVIAAFQLDANGLKALLAEDADPNARMGKHERSLFQDKWSLGWPLASSNWTPLLAVANSHRAPQPEEAAENTVEGLDAAMEKLKAVPPELIKDRDKRRVTIARLLIDAGASLDCEDGYGETALSSSIYNGYDDLSLLLIRSKAKIDTKTGIYIDGAGDVRPVHRATESPKVLAALIQRGANVNAITTNGSTPLHWAVMDGQVESVRLLLAAGANVHAKDNSGRLPSFWCRTSPGFNVPGNAEKRKIARLLQEASR